MKQTIFTALTLLAIAGATSSCKSKTDTSTMTDTNAVTQTSTAQATQPTDTSMQQSPAQPSTPPSQQTMQTAPAPLPTPGKHGDTVTSATGLQYIDKKVGKGPSPVKGQTITVNYTGMLTNGKTFDSNVDPTFHHVEPFSTAIGVGQVIPGWDEGMMSMKVGGKRRLIIPSDLGYGPRGMGATIPPNSTLIFDVELLGVK